MVGNAPRRHAAFAWRCDVLCLLCWLLMLVFGGRASAAARALATGLGISHPVRSTRRYAETGAIFRGEVSAGDHFCTASVVDSPSRDLLITAAHCVSGGAGGLFFVPGYHDGQAPYGVWALGRATVDARWRAHRDPDADVAFIAVRSRGGRRIQDLVGGYALGINRSRTSMVRITGYPDVSPGPITCANRISALTARQLRIYCTAYTDGTSGSPWVTGEDIVMGVIGGYEDGGTTPDVSYSPYFGDAVQALYRRAITTGA